MDPKRRIKPEKYLEVSIEVCTFAVIMEQKRIAIFASGSGSNCENLIRYFEGSELAKCSLVVSNKSDAYVLERAKLRGNDGALGDDGMRRGRHHISWR